MRRAACLAVAASSATSSSATAVPLGLDAQRPDEGSRKLVTEAAAAPDAAWFSEVEYWDSVYTATPRLVSGPLVRPWRGIGWPELRGALRVYTSGEGQAKAASGGVHALVLGCGDSSVAEDIFDDGVQHVTAVDFSAVVVAAMGKRNRDVRPGIRWLVGDVTELKFRDASFDVVLDIGVLDTVALGRPSGPRSVVSNVHRMLRPHGVFASISAEAPIFRLELLAGTPSEDSWVTTVVGLPRTDALDSRVTALNPEYRLSNLTMYISEALDTTGAMTRKSEGLPFVHDENAEQDAAALLKASTGVFLDDPWDVLSGTRGDVVNRTVRGHLSGNSATKDAPAAPDGAVVGAPARKAGGGLAAANEEDNTGRAAAEEAEERAMKAMEGERRAKAEEQEKARRAAEEERRARAEEEDKAKAEKDRRAAADAEERKAREDQLRQEEEASAPAKEETPAQAEETPIQQETPATQETTAPAQEEAPAQAEEAPAKQEPPATQEEAKPELSDADRLRAEIERRAREAVAAAYRAAAERQAAKAREANGEL